ncbi:MAG: response regulator [Chitinispirillaceae bacterium]
MSDNNDDLMGKLFEIFKAEVEEHLTALSDGLLQLEKRPCGQTELLEHLFREAHTLKGAARSINHLDIESIAASLENALAAWKKTEARPTREIFDLFSKALDLINAVLAGNHPYQEIRDISDRLDAVEFGLENRPDLHKQQEKRDGDETRDQKPLTAGGKQEQKESEPEKPQTIAAKEHTPQSGEATTGREPSFQSADYSYAQGRDFLTGMVKVHAEQINELMGEAEEMSAKKAFIEENLAELGNLLQQLSALQRDIGQSGRETLPGYPLRRGIPVAGASGHVSSIGTLHRQPSAISGGEIAERFEYISLRIGHLHDKLGQSYDSVIQHFTSLSAMIQRHQESVRKTGMEPFASLADSLRRMARNIGGDQGKSVAVDISGEDIELDRRILQELRTPLLHLIRNSVDHGIESPDHRRSSGKNPEGHIRVSLNALDNGRFSLVVEDDGAGIDPHTIRKAAVERNVLSPTKAESMGRSETLDLIFVSGFSTRADVSSLSGRGLGLAIVRENIRKMAGQVRVESTPGKGTRFTMQLPSSVSALRGILIGVGDREFILPTTFIDRVVRVAVDTIKTIEGKRTITSANEAIALVELAAVLGTGTRKREMPVVPVVIISFAGNKLAFSVDRIIEENDYVVKPLGPQLSRVRMITGAVVSAGGQSIPVLNITDMLLAERMQLSSAKSGYALEKQPVKHKVVLVVEDSVTSRTLLKAVLQSAGYTVKTAVDGADAYAVVKSEPVDVVVSDIDMPRMNGLELTRKIRADKDISNLPIVLVSALDSRQDQEAGIEAGADAYIVKSRFDNANLIDTVKRLV